MRKLMFNGFTLAEALIVMSILAVISALAIPQVGYSIQRSRNAAVLSRSVEQVETGCRNVIEYYNKELANRADYDYADSIYTGYSSIPATNGFLTGIKLFNQDSNSELFGFNENIQANSARVTGYTPKIYGKGSAMTNLTGLYNSAGLYASSATGAFIGIGATFLTTSDTDRGKDPIIDIIYIDANAEAKPNELGKDIFIFGLTDSCKMIPAGSAKMREIGYPPGATNTCADNNIGNGLGCADRVVRDGYKINY